MVELTKYRNQFDAGSLGHYADSLADAALPSIRLLADPRVGAAIAGASRLGATTRLWWRAATAARSLRRTQPTEA